MTKTQILKSIVKTLFGLLIVSALVVTVLGFLFYPAQALVGIGVVAALFWSVVVGHAILEKW